MYCSSCGIKLAKDVKFCGTCGKAVESPEELIAPKDQTKASPEPEVKPIEEQKSTAQTEQTPTKQDEPKPSVPPKEEPKEQPKPRKKSHGCLITCFILLAILGLCAIITGVTVYLFWTDKQKETFESVQNILADALMAKSLGDDMTAGKIPSDFDLVKTYSQTAVDNLDKIEITYGLSGYYNDVLTFCTGINDAASTGNTWTSRPEEPTTFSSKFSGPSANQLLQIALNHIATTKDYGDWAMASGDTETMRRISAELEAQYLFLNNLSANSTDSTSESSLIQRVFAQETVKVTTGICKKSGCGSQVKQILPGVVRSAHNYSVSEPTAPADWTAAWGELLNVIRIDNGYNLEGMAVIQEGTPTVSISPMEQAFNDECTTKSGVPQGGTGIKDRLPVTLTSGTMNCDYQYKGNSCWDVMTRTGLRFMGGDNGCPELGLLPKLFIPSTILPTSNSWDGNYTATMEKPNCDSPVELTMFQVTNNEVWNLYGDNAPIDENGNATVVYNTGSIMTVNMTFTSEGISGTWSSDQCSGTFTATKSGWF
jgi:hypothetical protein